jgi:hypothetical protein
MVGIPRRTRTVLLRKSCSRNKFKNLKIQRRRGTDASLARTSSMILLQASNEPMSPPDMVTFLSFLPSEICTTPASNTDFIAPGQRYVKLVVRPKLFNLNRALVQNIVIEPGMPILESIRQHIPPTLTTSNQTLCHRCWVKVVTFGVQRYGRP